MFGADMRRVNTFIFTFLGFLFLYFAVWMLLSVKGLLIELHGWAGYLALLAIPVVAGLALTVPFGFWRQDALPNERRIAFLAVILLTIMMAALTMFIGFILFYACLRGC
jgi:hypothetical protein